MAKKIELLGEITDLTPAEQEAVMKLTGEWYTAKKTLDDIKGVEMDLRKQVYAKTLEGKAQEGTNKFGLADGWIINCTLPYNYKVDPAITAANKVLHDAGVDLNLLVEWKPELRIGEYRKLNEEQKALVDNYLTITPGTPQMKVVLPKK